MNERNLRVLEFPKIVNRLSALAVSDPGKAMCLSLVPSGDPATVEKWQRQTDEAGAVRAYVGSSPIQYFTDVSPYLKIAEAGGTLSPRALLDVAELLKAARLTRAAIVTDREDTPLLTELASRLSYNRELEEQIFNAILSEDEIADRASPELYEIRRHIRLINDRMRDKLNQIAKSPAMAKYLSDTIVTMRNGRYVVPVKAECRQFVPGLIHDQSATGSTLFVEPMGVVEAGNDLKQWTAKEQNEIQRILAELSDRIAPDGRMYKYDIEVMAELDMVFAKAQLGRDMNGAQPKLNAQGRLHLLRARHPLIDPEKVVPIDLWMGGEFTQLIVTGPNTGGKTVTLKTVGLLALMAQAGLWIPAQAGSELAIFDEIFADIGDEQSIEQSLSTFSSHMTNIVAILQNVTPKSLALFDELGAGTDPAEGAALAMSILTDLLDRKVTVLATTHYSELKAFALSTKGVENASVEFDIDTLRPTYRLSIGVPGKSNAFQISKKLGLPDRLIKSAAERLSKDQIKFEDVIANAEYHRQIAEKERQLAEQAHRDTQKMRDEAEAMRKELEERRNDMLRKAKEEAQRVLKRAQRESETVISELKRQKKGEVKEHEIQNMRAQLQKALDDATPGLQKPDVAGDAPASVKIGDTVELTHLGTRGTIVALPDSKGEATVQAGVMKVKASLAQMRLVASEKPKKKTAARVETGISRGPVSMECDVRGQTLDEALMAVDIFLDGAVLSSLKNVSIIHGKGTGVLRSGVQDHLKHHPAVKEYRLGHYGEGEDGVTIVTLK